MAIDLVAGVVIAVWVITVVMIIVGVVLSVSFPNNSNDDEEEPVSTLTESNRPGSRKGIHTSTSSVCMVRFEDETNRAWNVRQSIYAVICNSHYVLRLSDVPGLRHLPHAFVEEALYYLGPALGKPNDVVFRGNRLVLPTGAEWMRQMVGESLPDTLCFLYAEQVTGEWILGDHVCATGHTWQTLWGVASHNDVAHLISAWFEETGFDIMTPTRKFLHAVQDHTQGVLSVKSLLQSSMDLRRCGQDSVCQTPEDDIHEFHDFELPEDSAQGCWDRVERIARVIVHDSQH